MSTLFLMFELRFVPFVLSILSSAILAVALALHPTFVWLWIGFGIAFSFFAVGVHDLVQTHHSVLRNYPIAAHLRFILEAIRPEIRQYFFEDEKDGLPFSRDKRTVVYQRAKMVLDVQPFGTTYNVYETGFEWVNHSMAPAPMQKDPFRITIGGPQCTKPYSASVFNVSAMSFGALSANAIRALNGGAKLGGFAHDTGEGGLTDYHLENGGDLIWEIGSGYFGARTKDGHFDAETFREKAAHPHVKCVSLKLSQGAKPGIGGVLPGAKVTAEIAEARGVPKGEKCVSPPCHTEFSTPRELVQFIARMREL